MPRETARAALRVTLLNQFYAPDISPTAQLAASLAEHRAGQGDRVTVIAGKAGYLEGLDAGSAPDGEDPQHAVRVRRVWTPDLGKDSRLRRLTGYLTYLLGALLRVVLLPRQDVVVVMTTPPMVVVVALAHKVLHPRTRVVLWSMDCYPDVAERFEEISEGGTVARALRRVTRWAFRHLDHVVVLDSAMGELLTSQYAAGPGAPPCSIVPNWERAALFPAPPPAGPRAPGPLRSLYLGNIGIGHRFDTVIDAAEVLGAEVRFEFIGGGARQDALLAAAGRRSLGNLSVSGYRPKAATPTLLADADVALITLDERSLGVISPSKLHANLAAGLPVLYVGPPGSNVDEAIQRFDCGFSLREGDVDGLVAAVRELAAEDDAQRAARRARSRHAFETAYCDRATLPQLDAVLDPAAAGA